MDNPSLQFRWSSPDALLAHVVSNVDSVIQCSEARMHYQHMLLPSLQSFITSMYSRCRLTPTVLIVALIYLDRLKRNLPSQARGEFDTHYKLFLAAILLASKYIEDHNRAVKSIYRAVAPLYCPRELVEMERSFLAIVNVSKVS
ncbi:cyclin domain-containing protein [Fennellomyces sp. T-0311]|nr:cyclin domain-containing protein [Fennellomyces sp. T-0311]